MTTNMVPISEVCIKSNIPSVLFQNKMRMTPLKEWLTTKELADRLSGTLKKNASIGFRYMDQLRHEALCQTLGWGWECCQGSRITFNDAITEGDCHPLTEVGWHVDRWFSQHLYPEDKYELKYLIIDDLTNDKKRREGVGMICRETSIKWIPDGMMVFCLLTEFKNGEWGECINSF